MPKMKEGRGCWLNRLNPSLVLLALRVLTISGAKSQQRFANEPSPQTAVLGSTVVLPCRIINKVGELQWTRDGFGLGNERELFAFKRYRMIGSDEEGDFSLRISPVTLEDDAEFQCQVTGWRDIPGVRSQTAKLTVIVPPEPPRITQGSVVSMTAGSGVLLECTSKGGKPAAEIQWMDGSGRVIQKGVQSSQDKLSDGHRFDFRSTLSFIAGREHHNTVFTCTATNPALHQPLRTQVRLEVAYPPEVSITHDKEGHIEGETARLTCSATANPSSMVFRWYRGSELVSDTNQTQLVLEDVSRDANLEDVTCEVTNAVGSSRKITRLVVHYGPSFRIQPSDVYAEYGQNVTLQCLVDGNPEPKVVWYAPWRKEGLMSNTSTLNLIADTRTVGLYQCIAKVEGFEETSHTIGLFLKGPPEARAEAVQWGQPGKRAKIECFVPLATSNSVSIVWTHKGREIDLSYSRYRAEQETTPEGVHHRLIIENAQLEDFGSYNCSAQNEFGIDLIEIILNRKKTLPLLLILSCVVGSIVFVLVVALAVILYGRKTASRQKEEKASKADGLPEKPVALQINDQNSGNESDLKVEMDNRTGSSMSMKDNEATWDKELEREGTPSYLGTNPAYLYPDNFTAAPMKVNGHIAGTAGGLTYGDYAETLSSSCHVPPGGGYALSHNPYSPHNQGPLITSSQRNLYPGYQDYEATHDTINRLMGLSSTLSNGYTGHALKNATAALPLAVQLTRTAGSPVSVADTLPPSIVPPSVAPNSSLPRLGIPVDPSQYIVSPRTQVLQGTLATHV